MKYITLILLSVIIIFFSCEKNDSIEPDPFLTWKIGFEYNENWNARACCYNSTVCLYPIETTDECNSGIIINIEREVINEDSLQSFARKKVFYINEPSDSGSIKINKIDFSFYKYSDDERIFYAEHYFFILDGVGYVILYKGDNEYFYENYLDEFSILLNSMYIKGKS